MTNMHANTFNVDQLYADYPLGTIADLHAVHDKHELRHIELMSKDVLTVAEETELDVLTDQFVNDLNTQVSNIVM